MKLFLCGGGSGKHITKAMFKFSGLLDKQKPILYVPLAMNENRYDGCANWFESEIKLVKLDKFEMVRSSLELSEKDFNNYSAIFIGGGNTYKLLNELKQNNNVDKIKTYLQNGGIVFGGSAGAIIFGKNIDACLLDDGNKIGLEDTEGFNYLNDISLLCHLKKKNYKKNINYLKEYTLQNKLIYLPEDDVLYIHNNKVSLIGDSKYLLFSNGNGVIHTSSNLKKDIKGKKD